MIMKNNAFPTFQIDATAPSRNTEITFAKGLPEILFISSFPPRECGIATYSEDLRKALNKKFNQSFAIDICPLESESEQHAYTEKPKYTLNTDKPKDFLKLAKNINQDDNIQIVVIQHEFGFFEKNKEAFRLFVNAIRKPVVLVFHTVLPNPDKQLRNEIQLLSMASEAIVVMTKASEKILTNDYHLLCRKVMVIPHGTHLVAHTNKENLKKKYGLTGKKILSTFGLLSSGKSIETTLNALPRIVKENPEVLFLVIGKTHPTVAKQEGEKYRTALEVKVLALALEQHVKFINYFLPLPDLLEYLQLTDIYLFTSKDPNQAVSGTFAYAIGCGCPVVSTPIPHAREVLQNGAGVIIDFEKSQDLAEVVNNLLADEALRQNMSSEGLHKMASTTWENASISYAMMFKQIGNGQISLKYNLPNINLEHIQNMTTNFGMIQFSKINQPDLSTGYTLDDNARAMISLCQHFELFQDVSVLKYIRIYLNFINYCLQPEGYFLNYIDKQGRFTKQNNETNLADSNGRAIWALGYLISMSDLLPESMGLEAERILQNALQNINKIHSTRAMGFIIKGLYYRNLKSKSTQNIALIKELADRLTQMYRHEAGNKDWQWFEGYLTYANSTLPEAMLCAWLAVEEPIYQNIAYSSFNFLLSKIFKEDKIKVISNKGWLQKGITEPAPIGGEQPIDISYTIIALDKFYEVFKEENYLKKMKDSLNWFLGDNHLHQIIYNPCTGGCYDGLEENNVNLNQGAESTVSYLMARLALEKVLRQEKREELKKRLLSTVMCQK